MDLNRVIIQGRLGGDPEGMAFQNGTTCSRFSIAVNGREKGSEIWVDVKAWGKQADNCNRYLQKGRAVIVEGRIAMDEWTDKNTGKRRRSMYVSADNVIFGSEQRSEQRQAQGQGGYQHQGGGYHDGGENAGQQQWAGYQQQQYQPQQQQPPQYKPPPQTYQPQPVQQQLPMADTTDIPKGEPELEEDMPF